MRRETAVAHHALLERGRPELPFTYAPISLPSEFDEEHAAPASLPAARASTLRRLSTRALRTGAAAAAVFVALLALRTLTPAVPLLQTSRLQSPSVTRLNEVATEKVKVLQVLAESRETCSNYPHLSLLETLHNNLGGQGPDAGDEGIRYKAQLAGGGVQERNLIIQVHANGLYQPFYNSDNGLSRSAMRVTGHSLQELCNHSKCDDAMYFGSINQPAGVSANVTFRFYSEDLKPETLNEIGITFFDLDRDRGLQAVESVSPIGSFTAYLSKSTKVKYELEGHSAKFSATLYGDGADNPINSRLLTDAQMDKAVTSMYSNVHEIKVTLGATDGNHGPGRYFFFDFVPTLLCAETVKEWPAWMTAKSGAGDAPLAGTTTTVTHTSTTSTRTTTQFVGKCDKGSWHCQQLEYEGGYWDLRFLGGRFKCRMEKAVCWIQEPGKAMMLEGVRWIRRQCGNSLSSMRAWFSKHLRG